MNLLKNIQSQCISELLLCLIFVKDKGSEEVKEILAERATITPRKAKMQERPSLGLDLKTPINVSLTAFYKRSFAFVTVKDRIPIILTQTIDLLTRNKEEILKFYGLDAADELKGIIGEISKLKYEVQTNKPILRIEGTRDAALYNLFLEEQMTKLEQPTSFNAQWLHLECYVYRRLTAAIQKTTLLRDLDPFIWQKEDAFNTALPNITQLANALTKVLANAECDKQKEFINLLKLNLWGNKCDLSISCGVVKEEPNHVDNLDALNANLLSDASAEIWDTISATTFPETGTIDIVLDNSGYEVFSDFCVADFLIKFKLAKTVRFYVKAYPWFVSDVTAPDFDWILRQLKSNRNSTLKKLGDKWLNYVKTSVWTIEEHDYWTLPYTFKDMYRIDPDLYQKLSEAKLTIFKGDLNYRKLVGEKNWLHTTPFANALEGFHPTKLCTLRTLKSDLICGLEPGVAEEAEKKDTDWLINGNFGIIQFCNKVVEIS